MTTLHVNRAEEPLSGRVKIPGDKSISHRALLLAAAARGTSRIGGLAPGEDVSSTLMALREFGAFARTGGGRLTIEGPGLEEWTEPAFEIDCGNSGTTMRLLAGLCARLPFLTTLDGDESLRSRPMDRVLAPLTKLGATVRTEEGGFPPLEIEGGELHGADIEISVASAQVKSAVLLAGLGASGRTSVTEPSGSRDHTERMLTALGAPLRTETKKNGAVRLEVEAWEIPSFDVDVAGDPSSAAFVLTAVLMTGGECTFADVVLNPTRIGFYEVAKRMGADIEWDVTEERMGEPVGTVRVGPCDLQGVEVAGADIPVTIDELPLVAVLATRASGQTVVRDAGELRVKESDRIEAVCSQLRAMGADIEERDDGFVVQGPTPLRGAVVEGGRDHRIAMALAVAATSAEGETQVGGFRSAAVSWPGFEKALASLGAQVKLVDE